ncbi:MFS transporter [Desulfofalx alkaliphila]|uniref:MFS transporter n=1 Tax=Desulfofalx alkaliphila TaxID=105483 RepID=UPI00068F3087|nr:MFS transporter [Desulfofalx alkaliphila]
MQVMREEAHRGGLHYGWIILLMGILVVCGALGLARFGFGMILPSMQQGLGLSHDQTGFIASANMFGYFISALVAGLLASRFGPRIVCAVGLVWVALAMALTGLANDVYTAALARFLTGAGSAGANVAIMGLAAAWFASNRRGMAMGFLVGGSGLGIAITGLTVPLVNGIFLEAGWRYNWFLLGIIAMLMAILAWFILRNNPSEKQLTPIGGLPDINEINPKDASPGDLSITNIIKIKGTIPLATLYFCFGFSYIITATYLVTFLVDELGCSQELAGQIWSTAGMLGIVSGLMWGMLSDRFGRRAMLVTIFLIQAGAYLLLQAKFTEGFLLWLPAVLYGLTAWSIPGIAASCCGDISDARRAPAVLGFITFVFGLGQVLGPVAAGFIKEFTTSFGGAFVLAAAVAIMGALFSSRLVIPNWRIPNS